ncbi:MAG TPA: outer membrane beta-barrel protein [Bacteroidales bacterium]|nr:outer membrane beta-barrel protein [Bacteroidales bacterium]
MKIRSIIIIIWFIGLSSTTSAQEYPIDKKAVIISGSGSLLSQGGDLYEGFEKGRATIINVSPTINYFILKHLFIGAGFDFYQESQRNINNNLFGIGPQIGYAFGGPDGRVFPYIDMGFRYYSSKQYYGGIVSDLKRSGSDAVFGFGVIVPVKTHIGILFEGGYHIIRLKNKVYDIGNSGNTLSIGLGISGLLFTPE